MNVITYHPWTLIYLNLPPSIGLVGEWSQWSNAETDLLNHAKRQNPGSPLTLINFVFSSPKPHLVGPEGMKSLASRYGATQIINYGVPNTVNSENYLTPDNDLEPLKNMLHISPIYILKTHPLLQSLQKVYPKNQNIVLEPPTNPSFSSTLKKDLHTGNLTHYHQLVGANYSFKGKVGHGNKIGQKIGYPTANILTQPRLPIKSGVYLVKVHLPNETQIRWGISDYHQSKNHQWIFETFILDFAQDIYDWFITIELISYHRPNVVIQNWEQLKDLVREDEIALRKEIKKLRGK